MRLCLRNARVEISGVLFFEPTSDMKPELLTSSSSNVLSLFMFKPFPQCCTGLKLIIPDVPYKVTIDPRSQLNYGYHFILGGKGPITS